MKYLLALVLGLGAMTAVSCSTTTADVAATETVTLDITGMT